jgi:proteasome lid subunit RPN8/RPN11
VFGVYFKKRAMGRALSHFSAAASGIGGPKEAMGLLVGNFHSYEGKNWVLVEDYVTAANSATPVFVRFSGDSFSALAKEIFPLVSGGKIVVGWFHSHPGLGCFLSGTDTDTQKKYFDHPLSIAAVCDPLRAEGGSVKKRIYRLNAGSGSYSEISFAVIS